MADNYSINAVITADSSGFDNTIKKVQNGLEKFGNTFKSFQGVTGKISSTLGKLTPQFTAMVSSVVAVTVALGKLGAEMASATSEIAKGTGAIGEDLRSLSATMNDALVDGVTSDVKTVGTMIADLNTRFGATGETLKNLTKQFDDFSRVTGTGAKEAINGVADVVNKWGLSVEEVNPLLDQLVVASQASGASVSELMSGLKTGQATFSQFGMSTTKAIGFLSALSKSGIDTNVALTGMKTALANFARQGLDAESAFAEITKQIQTATTETEALQIAVETFGARSGAEMVKVLRDSSTSADEFAKMLENAGGALARTDEASRTSADAIKELQNAVKGTFSGFGIGIENVFRDIIDSVRQFVSFIDPIVRPIGNIFGEVFSFIGQTIKILVENFVAFQKKYNAIFNGIAKTLQNVYEGIHKILGNILEAFKTSFGFIFAIAEGRWQVAWEYAKKGFLLFGKTIVDVASTVVNAVLGMINGLIEPFNRLIETYNNVAKTLGLGTLNLAKKIESVDFAKSMGFEEELAKVNAKIDELTGKTADAIIGELGAVGSGYTEIVGDTESAFELIDESAMQAVGNLETWNDKLLQQQIKLLETERDEQLEYIADNVKSEEEKEEKTKAITEKYTQEIIALKKQRLEKEKQNALASVKDTETAEQERLAIIQYYDTEIASMESGEQKKRITTLASLNNKEIKENKNKFVKMLQAVKNFSTATINVFKNIGTVISKAFSTIGKFVKTAFSAMKGGFTKLLDFNADEAIDNLLVLEDKILTFFVETLPKLPKYIATVMKSIAKTISQVVNNTNFKNIGNFISDMAQSVIEQAPQLLNAIINLFGAILDRLPSIIQTLVQSASKVFVQIVNAVASRGSKIADTLVVMIQSLVQGISDFISNGGWKTLLDAVLAIQKGLEKAIVENIDTLVQSLIDGMPDFIQALTESIVSASKTLARMIKPIIKLVLKLVEAILNVLFSDEVLDATIEVLVALIEAVFTELLPQLIGMLPGLIMKIIFAIVKLIPKLVVAIVKALVESFFKINWWQVICDIFNGFIEAFKELFGIHSPSTVFEGFGGNIVQGLVNGLKGIAEAVVTILQPLCEMIKSIFGALFQSIADVVKYTFDGIVNVLNAMGEPVRVAGKVVVGVLGAIGIALADIFNVISQIIKTITAIHIWIPFVGDVAIGGIDLGQVKKPDIAPYIQIIDALKDGTDNARKGLTLVGEQGPELVNFNGGEQVLNTRNTQNALADMGASKSNVFNVTFNNTQDTTAFAMLQQLKQYNRQLAFNGII